MSDEKKNAIYMRSFPFDVVRPCGWDFTLSKTVIETDILPLFEKSKQDCGGVHGALIDSNSDSMWNEVTISNAAFIVKSVYISNGHLCARGEILNTPNGRLLKSIDGVMFRLAMRCEVTATTIREVLKVYDIRFFIDSEDIKLGGKRNKLT